MKIALRKDGTVEAWNIGSSHRAVGTWEVEKSWEHQGNDNHLYFRERYVARISGKMIIGDSRAQLFERVLGYLYSIETK